MSIIRCPIFVALIVLLVAACMAIDAQNTLGIEFPITRLDSVDARRSYADVDTEISVYQRDAPIGGGPTVLGTYYLEVNANGHRLRLQLDTGSSITYLPSDECQIYDGATAIRSCSFYNKPLALSNTSSVGCDLKACSSCSGGCLLTSEYQDRSSVAAIAREVTVSVSPQVNATSVVGMVFRSSARFRYDTGSQIDGLFGLGYTPKGGFSTVYDSWIRQNGLPDVFSLQLGPRGGAFSIGGYNPAYFRGDLFWTAMVGNTNWYQVPLETMSINGKALKWTALETSTRVILDSGTTHNMFPTVTFNKIVAAITSHVARVAPSMPHSMTSDWSTNFFNSATCQTDVELKWLPTMEFVFQSKLTNAEKALNAPRTFTVSMGPEEYLYLIGSRNGRLCYSFGLAQTSSPIMILGDSFMSSFFTVFDRQNRRVGIAYSNKSSVVLPSDEPVTVARIPEFSPASTLPTSNLLKVLLFASSLIVFL